MASTTVALLNVIFLASIITQIKALCPKVNNTGELRLTQDLSHKDLVRLHQSRDILCCAAGYTRITWYRFSTTTSSWQPFPFGSDRLSDTSPIIDQENKTLTIKYATSADNTTFRCNVTDDSGASLHNDLLLQVFICQPRQEGPLLLQPKNDVVKVDAMGSQVELHCEGDFGCGNGFRNARWQVIDQSGNHLTDSRYQLKPYSRNHYNFVGMNLTIPHVRKKDLERRFVCILSTPQKDHGVKNMTVTIKYEPRIMVYNMTPVIVGVVVPFALIVVACFVGRLYGPRIRLCCYVHLSPKKSIIPRGGNYDHNMFLYHATEDENVARKIQETLKKYDYDVFLKEDVEGGALELQTYSSKSDRSAKTVFLWTNNLRQDKQALFFIQSFISLRHGKGILFIVKDKLGFTRKGFVDSMERAQNGDGDVEMDEPESSVEAEREDGTTEFFKILKILPKLDYPTDTASDRICKNFWCELRLNIPKFEDQTNKLTRKTTADKHSKDRNSSSSQPLLGGPETPVLAMENQATGNRTSQDQVFFPLDEEAQYPQPQPQLAHGRRRHRAGTNSDSDVEGNPNNVKVDVHCGQRQNSNSSDDQSIFNHDYQGDQRTAAVPVPKHLPLGDERETDTSRKFQDVFTMSGEISEPENKSPGEQVSPPLSLRQGSSEGESGYQWSTGGSVSTECSSVPSSNLESTSNPFSYPVNQQFGEQNGKVSHQKVIPAEQRTKPSYPTQSSEESGYQGSLLEGVFPSEMSSQVAKQPIQEEV